MIDIFNNVQKIDINLVLIGQGKEMSKLKNLVDNYNIKKVFLGYKFNPLPYMKKLNCMFLSLTMKVNQIQSYNLWDVVPVLL